MNACGLDVAKRPRPLEFDLFSRERSNDPRRDTGDEAVRFDDLTGPHDRSGSDERVFADLGPVEHDGTDSDQRPIRNATAVNDGAMADGNLVSQNRREAIGRHMKRRLILNVRTLTDANSFDIRPNDRAEEDARVFPDLDVSDYDRSGGDPHRCMYLGREGSKATDLGPWTS